MDFLRNLLSDLAAELVLVALVALVSGLALRYRAHVRRVLHGTHTASPDRRRTAYEAGGEIYVSDHAGGLRNVTNHPAYDFGPVWSPDSRRLAYTRTNGTSYGVYVHDLDTARTACVAPNIPGVQRPVGWNADGDLMVSLGGSYWTIPQAEIAKRFAGAQ